MPRIRSLHPSFWTDEKVGQLPLGARLLFQGLWNYADDEGRLEDSPRQLKVLIFPYDPPSVASAQKVADWLTHIAKLGMIQRYGVNGKAFLQVSNFRTYQRPQKPQPSKLPPIPLPSESATTTKPLPDHSLTTTIPLQDGIGIGIGIGIGEDTPSPIGDGPPPDGVASPKRATSKKRGATPRKEPDPLHPEVKLVFEGLKDRRAFQSPAAAAEASAIRWMLKQGYPSGEQLACYDYLKSQLFWADKPVLMPSVKTQIGEWKKNGKTERAFGGNPGRGAPSAIPGQRPGGAFDDID